MNSTVARVARLIVLVCLAGSLLAQSRLVAPGLIAHEWGTFTSLAGNDGQAVEWSPFPGSGPQDLPGFVEHLHWLAFKQGLRGTVRMETPVLYFYSPDKVNLSVHVGFTKGIITEWYPHADQPVHDGSLDDANAYRQHAAVGSISWNSVTVEPETAPVFPQELSSDKKFAGKLSYSDNRYYAARRTSSAPLHVATASGEQHEKFLFYRGVANFPVPLNAQLTPQGGVAIENSFGEEISNLVWFVRHGEQVGYRVAQQVEGGTVLDPPEMTARLEHVYGDLEEMLVAQGLYRDEAHAMIETWRDTWFEEGTRVLYIVPRRFVDSVLPLTIAPAPEQITRVFVGRMELVSPETRKAVATALASGDQQSLAKYGRFQLAIVEMIEETKPEASRSSAVRTALAPCQAEATDVPAGQRR